MDHHHGRYGTSTAARGNCTQRIFLESISRARPDRHKLFLWPCGPKHQNNVRFSPERLVCRFTPRRNPDIIVVVLFEGGEHGRLAARLATQVIRLTSIAGRHPANWRSQMVKRTWQLFGTRAKTMISRAAIVAVDVSKRRVR